MFIQQTFKNNLPMIYLVGTPIGNLDDFSMRGIEILQKVAVICCEDTRTSQRLLSKYQIKTKLISLHKFNEKDRIYELSKILQLGQDIAIISDAGAPVISDPGAIFLHELRKTDLAFNTTAVNVGPAYIHAIVGSGFTHPQNYFYGFISQKSEQAKLTELTQVISKYNNEAIIAFYESVHRIKDTIQTLTKILQPQQNIVVARELTKLNEEFIFGSIVEVNQFVQSTDFIEKGEFVILIDQFTNQVVKLSDQDIIQEVEKYIGQGLKLKAAITIVSDLIGMKKNQIYDLYLSLVK